MARLSILLALSGSESSRYAAETAWKLGNALDANVVAEHVIDSRTVWELLRNDVPGFIGSGSYIAVYESVIKSLTSLSNKLAAAYEAQAAGHGFTGECLIEDGNPVTVLSEESRNHDLIVVGHQPSKVCSTDAKRCHYTRYSIAEGIVHESTTPVLVVQSKPLVFKSVTILSEIDHLNLNYIRACLRLANLLKLPAKLEFWGCGVREESSEEFKANILQSLAEAKGMEIEVETFHGAAVDTRRDLFHAEPLYGSVEMNADSLTILPTRGIARERVTVLGVSPETFVRTLTLPSILFWPEEFHGLTAKEEKLAKTSTRKS